MGSEEMPSKKTRADLCEGPLWSSIFKFAFPVMLTGLLQSLYNAADTIIVGRFAGQEALAGVGTSAALTSLLLNLFLGLTSGVTVLLGNALGAKDTKNIHKIVHTSMLLCIIGGIFISLVGILFARPLLAMTGVPKDVMPQATLYMKIIFIGKLPMLIYNIGAAILRAKGDTKRPLYIVSVSGIVNVGLNLLFVVGFKMQAEGVAIATVIAQIINAVAILMILCNSEDETRLCIKKLKIYKKQAADVLKIGIPAGIQSATFSFSNVIIQSGINGFGAAAIAGSAAATNITNFYDIIFNAMFTTPLVFVSHNMGAKKYDRIAKIVGVCLAYVCIFWVLLACLSYFGKNMLIGFYNPGNETAIAFGATVLLINGTTFGLCGLMNVMGGTIRGMGHSFKSMIVTLGGVCGIRILWIATVFKMFPHFWVLFISYPISWLGTFLIHCLVFKYLIRKIKNGEEIKV